MQRSDPPAALAGLHVLFVEDDPDVREAIATLMEEEGAHVTATHAAEPALSALAAPGAGFDLLLTDIMLGGRLNGYDVATAALARHPGLGVVLATGYAAPAGAMPSVLAHSAMLLVKPFRRGDLLAAVAVACRDRRVAA